MASLKVDLDCSEYIHVLNLGMLNITLELKDVIEKAKVEAVSEETKEAMDTLHEGLENISKILKNKVWSHG